MKTFDPRLLGGVAAAILLAGAGGFGLARCTAAKPVAPPPAAEADHPETVAMTDKAIATAGILVQPVTAGGLSAEIAAQGSVTSTPGGQAVLTARASGAVTRLFKRLGDPVAAGETLAIVESREAAQIAADRSVAGARAALAQRTLARERSLYEQRVSPRVDYEQAQAEAAVAEAEAHRARAAAGAARITADGRGVAVFSPIRGRITAAPASLGAFVQPETELFRVADPALVQVEASVSAADAARLAPGGLAVVELGEGGGVQGRIRAVTPGLDPETRAATVVVALDGQGLQPGRAVRVRLRPTGPGSTGSGPPGAMTVPEEAVQTLAGRDVVFVRTDTGFAPRPVLLGRRGAGRVEIASGLTPGQVIAVHNAFLLKAELGKGEGGEH